MLLVTSYLADGSGGGGGSKGEMMLKEGERKVSWRLILRKQPILQPPAMQLGSQLSRRDAKWWQWQEKQSMKKSIERTESPSSCS